MEPIAEQTGGRGGGGRGPVSLVIPCRAEYVGLCRLVAGAIGNRESLDEETIADMKLVVTEACTCFVAHPDEQTSPDADGSVGESPNSLRVDFNVTADSWTIIISDPERRCHIARLGRCDPKSENAMGLTIIKALVDRMEQTDSGDEGSVLRLVKRLSPRTAPAD